MACVSADTVVESAEDDDDDDESGESAEDSSEVEASDPLLDLEEGKPAVHDHIGPVTVMKLEGTEPWQANKVLVKFKKLMSGRTGGRKLVETERWVVRDALSRTPSTPTSSAATKMAVQSAGVSSTEADVESALSQRVLAVNGRPIASAPELASLERERKQRGLKEPNKRARRPKMGARKTKEPRVDPQVRLDEFPENSLLIKNGKLFCDSCTIAVSLRKGTVRTHVSSSLHKQNLRVWQTKAGSNQAHLQVGL